MFYFAIFFYLDKSKDDFHTIKLKNSYHPFFRNLDVEMGG